MATVVEKDLNRYEVVKVLNPDTTSLNVTLAPGAAAKTPPPVSLDAFGRLRTSDPLTLFDSQHRYGDNGNWSQSVASGGSSAFNTNQGCIDLTVTTTSGSSVTRETNRVFSYQPGKSLLVLNTFVFNQAKTGLRQRVGYFNAANGCFVQLDGSALSFVLRSSVSGSLVDTAVARANWNVDKLDGTGPSGITLDITQVQIFWLDFEWLGAGNVRAGFMFNGQFVHCHTFQHANVIATTYITTATLPLRCELTNTAATASNSTLKQICSTVISEGGYQLRGRGNAAQTPITSAYRLATAGTYYPVLSIRLLASPNRLDSVVIPTGVGLLGITGVANYNWRLVVRGTTTGGTWAAVGGNSPVELNTTGTAFTGGRVALSGFVAGAATASAGTPIQVSTQDLFSYQLERDGLTSTPLEITLAVAASSSNADLFGSLEWNEVVY